MFRRILNHSTGRVLHPWRAILCRAHSNVGPHKQQQLPPARRLSKQLGWSCRHLLVPVVDELAEVDSKEHYQVLKRNKLNQPGVRRQWLPILATKDVHATLQDLTTSYSSSPLSGNVLPQPPIWVILHLLCNRAQTHAEVTLALELVFHHLSTAPTEHRPVLLISTLLRLAELQITAPLRYLVKLFLSLEPEANAAQYNLFLCALSLAPASKETSTLAIAVMQEMAARCHKTALRTYDMLLRRQFVTLDLLSVIEKQMLAEGFVPLPRHLQAFLRVAAKHGHRQQAARYLDRLHHALRGQDDGQDAPYGSSPKNHGLSSVKKTEDNLTYLKSFKEFSHVFRHMRKLAEGELRPTRTHRFIVKMSQSGKTHADGLSSPIMDPGSMTQPGSQTPDATKWLPPRRSANVKLGVDEWLAGLYVASRDPTVHPQSLLHSFREGASSLGSQLTISGYLVVIRGLISKGDVSHAVELWDELRGPVRQIVLNTVAVGVGVKALTLNHEPHRAFALLEEVHAEQLQRERTQSLSSPVGGHGPKHATIIVDTINRFMISLQRLGRPDVVFELWDSMHVLYGLYPDAYTLNILLKTARWAKKYDNTLRGALAQLGLRGRRAPVAQDSIDADLRGRAQNRLAMLLDPGRRSSLDGMWGSEPAPNVALRIATQVLLHNYPELRGIRHPVRALRHSSSAPALSPVSDAFHSLLGSSSSNEPSDSTLAHLAHASQSPPGCSFPNIVPTDVTFRAYIDLLATLNLTFEIPLALAWMRTLGIFPSKTTLAAALVHWAEVALDAPLIERLKGGPGSSPYTLLKSWMLDWVGDGNMPRSEEMTREMKRLAAFRDAGVGERLKWRSTTRR